MKSNLQIAIDGPVGAGKSVGANRLAQKLKILYVNTGAMYRAVAWIGLQNGLDLETEEPLFKLVKKSQIELKKTRKKNSVYDVFINGKEETSNLFSPRIHWGSSQVAVFPKIRKHLVMLQQKIANSQSVVMEGRDITTVVLPEADLKIYMTADIKIRAQRRLKELLQRGEKPSLKEVIADIKKRDYNDMHRKADPLKIAPDAWILDTSNLSLNQEVTMIIHKLKALKLVR